MIIKLKYKTQAGNKMEMDNCPIPLGIELMLSSCSLKEKQELRRAINDAITNEENKESA